MRVLFVTKTNPVGGGVERWLADVGLGLKSKGHEVMIALVRGASFHDPDRYLDAHPELKTLVVCELDGRTGVYEGRMRALERCLATVEPDVCVPVMVHEALYAAARRRKAGQTFRVLYPVHELGVWAFHAIEECQSVIDAVGAVNRLILDYLRSRTDFSELELLYLPLGAIKPLTERHNKVYGNTVRLGYCGKLVAETKRAPDLIQVCEVLDELEQPYKLSIAGSGSEESVLRSGLAKQVDEGRVEFLGELSRVKLYSELYPNLDMLLILSDSEAGPLVAREAMLHGVAVLTSRHRGLRAEGVVQHDENALLFPVGQPEAAARLIAEYWAQPQRLRQIAESGRRTAERRYTNGHMTDRWHEAIVKLCQKPLTNQGAVSCVGRKASVMGYLEHLVRQSLDRPRQHPNPHGEWPRFVPGPVSRGENNAFQQQLDRLEQERFR